MCHSNLHRNPVVCMRSWLLTFSSCLRLSPCTSLRSTLKSYTPESALSSLSSLLRTCSLASIGACCTSAAGALRFSAGVGTSVEAAS